MAKEIWVNIGSGNGLLTILYSQYPSCLCPRDLRRQGICRHSIEQISWNIPSLASKELILWLLMPGLLFFYFDISAAIKPIPIFQSHGVIRREVLVKSHHLLGKVFTNSCLFCLSWKPPVLSDHIFNVCLITVGERTVALKIIARCSITQTPTGQSKVWWWHARKMVVIYFKRI